MTDEGLREIQLGGKQLVFLFMTATVVAVVVFLCGVMVGRGVPTRAAGVAAGPADPGADPTVISGDAPSNSSAAGAPVAGGETLSYPGALLGSGEGAESTLVPVSEAVALGDPMASPAAAEAPRAMPKPVVPAPERAETPEARPARAAVDPVATVRDLSEPTGSGFVVQVAAVRERLEANNMARRLADKGYPAFVTTAGANFRVRVGKYDNRGEADAVAERLRRDERIEPWVTR
jgi:cell division septation protein DedD